MAGRRIIREQSEGDDSRRTGLAYLEAYITAWSYMRDAKNMIEDSAGIKLKSPTLKITSTPSATARAQLYNEFLYVYGSENVKADVVSHELYHYAQNLYRGDNYKRESAEDSETRFLIKNSATREALARASMLWNIVNEAGAYLFGYYFAEYSQGTGKITVQSLMDRYWQDYHAKVGDHTDIVLDFVFDKSAKMCEFLKNGAYEVPSVTHSAILVAFIILKENNFDFMKTFKDLMQDPEVTLERLERIGRHAAAEMLREFS
ncbi:MAG: hypothetical protein ACP5MK_03225 [Candidatus Micrarchaeia archaeon]